MSGATPIPLRLNTEKTDMKERIIITTGTEEVTIVLADFEVETPQEIANEDGNIVEYRSN